MLWKTLFTLYWESFKLVDPTHPHFDDKHRTLSFNHNLKFKRTNQSHRAKCWFCFRADTSSLWTLRGASLLHLPPPSILQRRE